MLPVNDAFVSVVVPVYNVESFLEECLESLLNQTYTNYEIIAVNDGSTDGSLRILNAFAASEPRLKIINQENAGLSAARNRGIEAAKGKYILFVDSDDLVVPEMIMTIASGFEQSDSEVVTFSYSRFMETPENRKFEVISKNLKAKEYPSMEYFKLVLEIPTIQWIPAWTYAFNLEFLRTNNLRFKKGLLHEDVEFFPQNGHQGKFNYCDVFGFIQLPYPKRIHHDQSIKTRAEFKRSVFYY
jgi:glycosyltransferase involved in cell wall biosynthesis